MLHDELPVQAAERVMRFVVQRDDLTRWSWHEEAPPRSAELRPGEALLRHDRFALTSNNITYGKFGDAIQYWRFFPIAQPWGQIPVWGIGEVLQSRETGLAEGERIYGYFPMASHLVVTPGRIKPTGFIDTAPHRETLPATYNEYLRIDHDPSYDNARTDQHLVLRPLFSLSFFMAEYLHEQALFGAEQVIISSASSKTALGLAFLLSRKKQGKVIGLTSQGNAPFVARAGHYDEVVAYAELETLPRVASAFVDIAGDSQVQKRVHTHLGEAIVYSGRVGATHWDADAGQEALPGARPEWFFTPSHILKRREQWGTQVLRARLSEAWLAFLSDTDRWLRIARGSGPEAIERTYRDVVGGRLAPDVARILSFQT